MYVKYGVCALLCQDSRRKQGRVKVEEGTMLVCELKQTICIYSSNSSFCSHVMHSSRAPTYPVYCESDWLVLFFFCFLP
jgi:hypothetical protein